MLPTPPDSILVICLRRLGDVLLSTPVVDSLRRAYPRASIDALVFPETAAVLSGVSVLRRVIPMPREQGLALLRQVWRRYDLAVAVTNSDRSHYAAFAAGRHRVAVCPPHNPWKRLLIQQRIAHDPERVHAVAQGLALITALGLPRSAHVLPPQPDAAGLAALDAALGSDWAGRRYAVLHAEAMYPYKGWTADGWLALIRWLSAQGLEVVLSGGPAAPERAAVQALADAAALPPGALHVVAGKLPFAALTPLIEHAALYVGPDTSVTHLAAATGCPTLALFGPSSPVTWGPWPQGWTGQDDSPWRLAAPLQRVGNVAILQGDRGRRIGCIPCLKEGCEQRLDSRSECLDRLSPARVIAAAAQLLTG